MTDKTPIKSTISPLKRNLFGVFFFIAILLVIELVLGLFDLDKHDHKFMPKSSYPLFVEGKGDLAEHYVTNPHFGSYINTQKFLKEKPPGLTRIFVVGGSAAYGFPLNEEYGFSGYLRRALDQAYPDRFEVINASGMSFGSHRVLDVLKDVVQHEPDVVIIYSGNNEYVEKNVLQEVKTTPGAITKLGDILDDTDIYRALRLALFKASPKTFEKQIKQDITDIRTNPQVNRGNIGRSSLTDNEILANYRNNISSMRDLLAGQSIKAIYCTVPVDLGGWIPEAGMPKFVDQNSAQRWMELANLREEAFRKGDLAQEADYMRQILEITPDDPGMRFNLGKIFWMMGRYQDSYQQSLMAKDLDSRPIRALSSFNEVIRSTSEQSTALLADLEDKVREMYLSGQAKGIFLDYCHLTEAGHKLVANWLLATLDRLVPEKNLDINLLKSSIQTDQRAMEKNDFVRGHELYARALTFENNGLPDLAVQTYLDALKYLPEFDQIYTNLGHIYANQKNLEKAVETYNKALQFNSKAYTALLSLGYISLQKGQFDQAEDYFLQTIRVTPELPGAYSGLGDVNMQRREFARAINYYNKSLRMGQDSIWLRNNLAKAYLELGNRKNAIDHWQAVLKFNPFDQETRYLIKKYSSN